MGGNGFFSAFIRLIFTRIGSLTKPRLCLVQDCWLVYNEVMNHAEVRADEMTYLGHVQNGIIVLDARVQLPEGVPVRVEVGDPVSASANALSSEEQIRQLQSLFARWNEEDATLPEDQADVLRKALEENRGLGFRNAELETLLR
jgi:hypothetical protein